jgi:hypothetical protein
VKADAQLRGPEVEGCFPEYLAAIRLTSRPDHRKTLDRLIISWNKGAERIYGSAADEATDIDPHPSGEADELRQIMDRPSPRRARAVVVAYVQDQRAAGREQR